MQEILKQRNGGLDDVPADTVKTKSRDGELNPTWNETLAMSKASYGPGKFINFILWDANIAKNTPIGFHCVPTTTLLNGLTYDPKELTVAKEYKAAKFESLLSDKSQALTAEVAMS